MPDEDKPALEAHEGNADNDLLVVGIGASAGGLEAIRELIQYVPPDGVAYVVVQHLAPDHASFLAELLSRSTPMPVVTATDGATLEPGHVYVIPPNADIAVTHGVVRVRTLSAGQHPHFPVDYLFRSLAENANAQMGKCKMGKWGRSSKMQNGQMGTVLDSCIVCRCRRKPSRTERWSRAPKPRFAEFGRRKQCNYRGPSPCCAMLRTVPMLCHAAGRHQARDPNPLILALYGAFAVAGLIVPQALSRAESCWKSQRVVAESSWRTWNDG